MGKIEKYTLAFKYIFFVRAQVRSHAELYLLFHISFNTNSLISLALSKSHSLAELEFVVKGVKVHYIT